MNGSASAAGVLFGFFRAADLGQQYDTVSRAGGNFSFLFDTLGRRFSKKYEGSCRGGQLVVSQNARPPKKP